MLGHQEFSMIVFDDVAIVDTLTVLSIVYTISSENEITRCVNRLEDCFSQRLGGSAG
jgi:hypothetical protein